MENSHAIHIRTDGAMDCDSNQTGGTGFLIEFPESSNLPPIHESFRRDRQGIHRLEMIAILEGMETLLKYIRQNEEALTGASRVIIHTDRYSLIDSELNNPWRIKEYRKNGWKNHEGKPVKDSDLLDDIDKTRRKLSKAVRGRVEIVYVRRKRNKKADKLSKKGKRGDTRGRRIIREKNTKVARRKFDGPEVDYETLQSGETLEVRIYRKDPVSQECEISAEICDGDRIGQKIKIYVNSIQESELHRHHHYQIVVDNVFKHHVRIKPDFEERDLKSV